ncbi:hypothetical protein LTR50_006941 [Elasticomyces elasticus]|nr:hypothetical protein LTR50_006941 [Elasticomyces elasticus]
MPPTSFSQVASTDLSLPSDTYIYSLAQNTAGNLATVSSDDSVCFLDRDTLASSAKSNQLHTGVTCVTALADHASSFLTAGRDGAVRCWDPRVAQVAVGATKSDKGSGLTALSCQGHLIAAGTESLKEGLGEVEVLVWDTRKLDLHFSSYTPLRTFTESHNDTITQLSFHPTQSQVLLSGSTDGLVSLFDTTIADEDDALVQVLNHSSAIHCAGFISTTEAYAISSDEQLSIYGLNERFVPDQTEEDAPPVKAFGDVREQLRCSYVVEVVKCFDSSWIAAGNTEGRLLELTPLQDPKSWKLLQDDRLQFIDAHGDEIVRDLVFDSKSQAFYTCGEDGYVRVWTTGTLNERPELDAQMDIDNPDGPRTKKRKKTKERREKARFTPY